MGLPVGVGQHVLGEVDGLLGAGQAPGRPLAEEVVGGGDRRLLHLRGGGEGAARGQERAVVRAACGLGTGGVPEDASGFQADDRRLGERVVVSVLGAIQQLGRGPSAGGVVVAAGPYGGGALAPAGGDQLPGGGVGADGDRQAAGRLEEVARPGDDRAPATGGRAPADPDGFVAGAGRGWAVDPGVDALVGAGERVLGADGKGVDDVGAALGVDGDLAAPGLGVVGADAGGEHLLPAADVGEHHLGSACAAERGRHAGGDSRRQQVPGCPGRGRSALGRGHAVDVQLAGWGDPGAHDGAIGRDAGGEPLARGRLRVELRGARQEKSPAAGRDHQLADHRYGCGGSLGFQQGGSQRPHRRPSRGRVCRRASMALTRSSSSACSTSARMALARVAAACACWGLISSASTSSTARGSISSRSRRISLPVRWTGRGTTSGLLAIIFTLQVLPCSVDLAPQAAAGEVADDQDDRHGEHHTVVVAPQAYIQQAMQHGGHPEGGRHIHQLVSHCLDSFRLWEGASACNIAEHRILIKSKV
ncbi:hypothetical protein [Thermobaculum terrenum]|uniref:hypothetical protein n=1 Tax=Thermobaculum terrenum TaxID=166501 RepID=UPI0011D101D1|nr:hypothetical protein [Thermobaculum terrenum]